MRSFRLARMGCVLALCLALHAPAADDEAGILWTTGRALMPAWGFYPNGSEYGGSEVLGGAAAWGTGRLTWIVEVPEEGEYHVWCRKYGGYGSVRVLVDEQPLSAGRGGAGGAWYVWQHLGRISLTAGAYHLDIEVGGGMLDAVLLTLDSELEPEGATLPPPLEEPVRSATRSYRDDSALRDAAGEHGFVVARLEDASEHLNDFVPKPEELLTVLRMWGAAGQGVSAAFGVRALVETGEFSVSLERLRGPDGVEIAASRIDARVVHLRERIMALYEGKARPGLMADLLLRDDRTALPPTGKQGGFGGGSCRTALGAHTSRQFHLVIEVPEGSPPGLYEGMLVLEGERGVLRVPVELEVLAMELLPVEGWYGVYYPAQTVHADRANYITEERYLAELEDQVRHGCNGVTLYGGLGTLELARRGGMTESPVIMGWPSSQAPEQVKAAQELGFPDLYYYGIDEPHGEAVERCRKEAERRLKAGLHMFTALNSQRAWEALRDVIDRPVLNIYVFHANSGAAAYAREQGFVPISYWVTSVAYPRYYRALAGLYNSAAGFAGTAPWGYADSTTETVYAGDRHMHAVSYPDEEGRPIPSLRWEAFREGVDDVRYLQALDRAMAAAGERLAMADAPAELDGALTRAREVRQSHFGGIGGAWFHYLNSLRPESLPTVRRALAEATVELHHHLKEIR